MATKEAANWKDAKDSRVALCSDGGPFSGAGILDLSSREEESSSSTQARRM